nr:MAG TPA: hypothetical protein [Caudoviricetes sp.]
MTLQVTPEIEREFRRYNWLVKVLENTPWYRKHANLVGAALATILAVLSLDPLVHHLLPPVVQAAIPGLIGLVAWLSGRLNDGRAVAARVESGMVEQTIKPVPQVTNQSVTSKAPSRGHTVLSHDLGL